MPIVIQIYTHVILYRTFFKVFSYKPYEYEILLKKMALIQVANFVSVHKAHQYINSKTPKSLVDAMAQGFGLVQSCSNKCIDYFAIINACCANKFYLLLLTIRIVTGAQFSLKKTVRRERDSNPRYTFGIYALSRRAPSTTRTPLRFWVKTAIRLQRQ